MYLWTSLFHEALFEVVPGDEGHELEGERQTLIPPHTPEVKAPRQRGSVEWGRMYVLSGWGYIWKVLPVIFIFQQNQSTAPQMLAELAGMAESRVKDLLYGFLRARL